MTLQRRVMLFLLLSAPLVWAAGLFYGLGNAREEINELFDTQQVRIAQQLQALLPALSGDTSPARPAQAPAATALGNADLDELSIAVWNRQGQLLLADREGALMPYRSGADGFIDHRLGDQDWRTYYLRAASGEWLVAVGQLAKERDELVHALLAGQLLPWVLTLPLLLLAMAAAVRHALKPVRELAQALEQRSSDDLRPLPAQDVPGDLLPLVTAMNGMLRRVELTMEHERRFTADAAHELRTPLAALQSQWDAARLVAAQSGSGPSATEAKITEGVARLSRLVTQMLSLSRLEHHGAFVRHAPIDWPALVEQVLSEVLPLAERGAVELACEWPAQGAAPLLHAGDSGLLAMLLRNLLDNAVRHAPSGGQVRLRLASDSIEVIDEGPGMAEDQLPRLGERFFHVPSAGHIGSGLGLSIAVRIAALHGLRLDWRNAAPRGFVARLRRDRAQTEPSRSSREAFQ
jgi:two-component system sensor histidine kinase QseC